MRAAGRRSRPGTGYLFLLPFLLPYLLFYFGSLLYSVYLSLFTQRGLNPAVYVGLQTFQHALHDPQFLGSLRTVGSFALLVIPAMLLLALAFALYLDGKTSRLSRTFTLAVFLPYALPGVVSGLLWGYLYSKSLSPFGTLLGTVGLSYDFLSPDHLLFSIANIFAWTWTGYNTIVLVSALRSVPAELYEAARVDGGTPLQIVRFIKLPLLAPTLTLVALFALIAVLQLFTEPFVLKSLSYVPTNLTPNLYIYTTAFGYGNFNYAATLATVVALLSFALSAGLLLLINRQRRQA